MHHLGVVNKYMTTPKSQFYYYYFNLGSQKIAL